MQIVIDIPEEYYNLLQDMSENTCTADMLVIRNWLPLEDNKDSISVMELLNNLHKYFAKGFENDEWWNSTHVLQAVKDCKPELFDPNYVGK